MSYVTHKAFVSYAGTARPWALWIANELEAVDICVTMDVQSWHTGQSLQDNINRALTECDLFVAAINDEYFRPERWSKDEITAAYSLKRAGRISLYPYLVTKDPNVEPLYRDTLAGDLSALTEQAARHQMRLDIGRGIGRELRTMDSPAQSPPFPGRVLMGRPRFKADPHVEKLIRASQSSAKDFIKLKRAEPDTTEVDAWRRHALDLSRQYAHEPPQKILEVASDGAEEVRAAIEHTKSPSLLGELHAVYSLFCGLLSYAALDLGDAQAAYDLSLATQYSASLSDNAALQAWGIGTQAMILRFDREFQKSLEVLSQGSRLSLSGPSLARLRAQEALGYSEVHDKEGALEAIRLAEEAMGTGPDATSDEIGIFLFPQAKYHYYAGTTYLGLGEQFAEAATVESAKAIERFQKGTPEEESYSDELLAHVHLANGYLFHEDLEAVLVTLEPVFSAPTSFRTSWHFQWLQRLLKYLQSSSKLRTANVVQDVQLKFEQYRLENPNLS